MTAVSTSVVNFFWASAAVASADVVISDVVAVVMSYEDYQASLQTITPQVAALISEAYPLRGKAAGDSMRQNLASMSNLAAEEGLTLADVTRKPWL